ncbi:alpha/beta fold hydrolase [Actinomycetospora sp. TBRC 11914]|uniref:alpha/beta fold hydrolase n=1 Tax=Actinomycetospora sp. TBRC 11914 TaxID=2729387 RepID=UPI00145E50CD|nr:alpha/beta fold hydrolase [Actinomycetospora sp. TBRC 11914]NMO88708.1 alpha/beta fold hydrolase [Actinomycetospora sp. TBRC 11914]
MVSTRRTVTLHGHPMAWIEAGPERGEPSEVVVLLHGVAGSSSTWEPVLERLAGSRRLLLAPDLLGHGESAGPSGDFSMGAFANGLRDLLAALGHRRVTVVGHSLGGGVAMQFAYQFPEMCSRLVLVSSGGLGRGVSPTLRLAALPGAGVVVPLLARTGALGLGVAALRAAAALPLRPADQVSLREYARHAGSLIERAHADAFVDTVRGVIGPWGQRVTGTDRLYLTEGLPTLVVWGRRDPIIPVGHAYRAASLMPGSRLEVFDSSGHFPHCDEPGRFAALLTEFCDATEPGRLDAASLGPRLGGFAS